MFAIKCSEKILTPIEQLTNTGVLTCTASIEHSSECLRMKKPVNMKLDCLKEED